MNSSLVKLHLVVKEFLDSRWGGKSPLLVAYSGGPDSKALLYAVKSWGKAEIHLAHVDHGWRTESAQEALEIESEAERLGLLFHTTRFEKKTTEMEARSARLAFFASLREKISYQAVLLGHQADDLAETALKRLFEGAHLTRLWGMKADSVIDGLPLWRPMLDIRRREIEKFLSEQSLVALDDPSNRDPHYLRARMRLSLMPVLEEAFGKGTVENLRLLASRSKELDDYLAIRAEAMQERVKRGPFGIWIDCEGVPRLELRYLLQRIGSEESLVFSRDVLEKVLDGIRDKKADWEIGIRGRTMILDRGHFFLIHPTPPQFKEPISLEASGWQRSGDWRVFVGEGRVDATGWRSIFGDGSAAISCPAGSSLELRLLEKALPWDGKTPAFLRKLCPFVVLGKEVVGDFLNPGNSSSEKIIKIFVDSNS
jgi:tRNA(Ile)-lysidine synthase